MSTRSGSASIHAAGTGAAASRAVAVKAMSAEPDARYRDVPALLLDLQRFQDGLAVEAYRESVWQRARRFAMRNQVLLLLLAAYLAVRFFLLFLRNL